MRSMRERPSFARGADTREATHPFVGRDCSPPTQHSLVNTSDDSGRNKAREGKDEEMR